VRTFASGLTTHLTSGATSMSDFILVIRTDDESFAWTTYHEDVSLDVEVAGVSIGTFDFLTAPGFEIKSLISNVGMAVDTANIHVIADADIQTADILNGVWDGARVYFGRHNPDGDNYVIKTGNLGNFRPLLGQWLVEFRDLRQSLQNDTTRILQADCDYRLGDDNCTVDLALYTFTGAVTDVATHYQFTDALFGSVDAAYFTEGELTWTSGNNEGRRFKISVHETGGVLTLAMPALQAIQVGDAYSIIAGCRKRRADCRDKFDNVLNFPGADLKPSTDNLTNADPEGGGSTPVLESALVTNPPTPALPEPGEYTTSGRIVGLDYSNSSTNQALNAGFPLLIKSFSTGDAASFGASYINDLQVSNPTIQVGSYVALNELADPVSVGTDFYDLWVEVNARNWWARASYPAGAKRQWTSLYGNYELNMTSATTANGSGQRLPQYKASFDFTERLNNLAEVSWLFIDNFRRGPLADNVDYNCDGTAESKTAPATMAAFRAGFMAYVAALRALRPGLKIIANVNHGLSDPEYFSGSTPLIDAGFMEGALGRSWGLFSTSGIIGVRNRALDIIQNTAEGMAILNAYGESTNYQLARFSLTMAMLIDAHLCYVDDTPNLHAAWFDEFDQDLGVATDAAPSTAWSNGVWARRFENGVVLCNPTSTSQSVNPTTLGTYTRFTGTQDATTNSGAAIAGAISIASQDGLVLLTV
jgi:uncharacterized phage protein (TIGR02218 family)